jgi:hypothetical protein
MYEPVKAVIARFLNGEGGAGVGSAAASSPALLHKVLSGMVCGGVSSAICNPTDVVKVRMQADGMNTAPGAKPRYRHVFHAFGEIARTEGARGLYKGVSPTVQRAAVVAAVELSSYDECKTLMVQWGWGATSVATHFGASIMAGFLSTIASSPLDVVKSRVMNQPVDANGRGLRYSSTLDCFRKSTQAEGVLSLWKGFLPNFGACEFPPGGGGGGAVCVYGGKRRGRAGITHGHPLPLSPNCVPHPTPPPPSPRRPQPASAPTASSPSW